MEVMFIEAGKRKSWEQLRTAKLNMCSTDGTIAYE
jgi:hypothetical protein